MSKSDCARDFTFSIDGSVIVGRVAEPNGIAVWESDSGAELVRHRACLPEFDRTDVEPGDFDLVTASGFSDDAKYVLRAHK